MTGRSPPACDAQPVPLPKLGLRNHDEKKDSRHQLSRVSGPSAPGWMEFNTGMYEPLYWSFDVYPSVVPRVRVRGVMTLFLAGTILWALVWCVRWKNCIA